jgi:hypothetical protein
MPKIALLLGPLMRLIASSIHIILGFHDDGNHCNEGKAQLVVCAPFASIRAAAQKWLVASKSIFSRISFC